MNKKTIVIVGASRGIGAELVKLLAQNKEHRVIALSRNTSEMQRQFEGIDNVDFYSFDLS
jgi:short-subunit dehydrogenase